MMAVNRFGLSRLDLKVLMSQRKDDAVKALEKYEGVESIAQHLETNLKAGLNASPQDLESRRAFYGVNQLPQNPPKSFLALCLDAIQDPTLIILTAAAILSIVLGVTVEQRKDIAWIEGFAILAAVVLVVFITALNDWTKDRQFRDLQKKLDSDTRFSVLRDGDLLELPLVELVVGDVAQFKYGNTFPVDGILVQGYDIKVDEASLTGESDLVKKDVKKDPMLLAGTQVMEGGGTMLVTAVGEHSQQGIIFTLLSQKSEEEGGFITQWLRRIRDKLCPPKKEEEDPVLELAKQRQADLEGKDVEEDVKEYDPEQPIEVPPLTGMARFNPVKRMQQKKKIKQQKKNNKPSKVESGSVLQKKLNKLALYIGYAGTAACVLCILVLVLKFAITKFAINREAWDSATDFSELLHFVIIGITVLVVAVPEGLPLAVTIALAFSVKKMLKDNNLVRYLHACETMGNATAICSDKTGTLTTNRMTVVESYFAGTRYEELPKPSDLPDDVMDALKLNIAVNSSYTSKLIMGLKENEEEEKTSCWQKFKSVIPFGGGAPVLGQGLAKQVGNVTECALLGFIQTLGVDYDAVRAEFPTESFVKVFTFNSARKSMSTVLPLPGGGYRLFTKGASEIVLSKCTHIMAENGRIAVLSEVDKKDILSSVVQSMASNALRTIGLAYRDFPSDSSPSGEISSAIDWDNEEEVVSDLTCIGIVGIQDPVRPEVPSCIKSCQKAGITVRMVTGDNIETARAIADKCGIIRKGDGFLVLDGKEFNKRVTDANGSIDQEKVDKVWPRLRVLARSSPTDKYTLVDGIIRSRIHKNREVVAVTGDGTNDGPALKRADVGFAMGIAGTDVAKGACDIILTDDNFASIVKAVMWGRNVYDSISKFLQFQLTVNIVAVLLTLIAAFTIGDSPLRAIQLLWVNLIMDTFASLALATEAPTPELLKRKPYGRKKSLISKQMWVFLAGHSLYQLTVLLVILFAGPRLFGIDDGAGRALRADPSQHFTIIFNTFVMFQIFNEINARKIHGERNVFNGIWRNWIFIVVMLGQVTVQIILVQFGDVVFSTSGLTLELWLWCIFLGSTELLVGQLLTLVPVSKLPDLFRPTADGEPDKDDVDGDPLDDGTRARVLWVKSLSRLRAQIRVVNAFRSGLEHGSMGNIAQFHGTPRSYRYGKQHVTGIETAV